jgi:restriction endonuclease S subunit
MALSGQLSASAIHFKPRLLGDIAQIKTGKLDANASSEDGKYPFFTCAKDPLRISTFSYDTECVLLAGNGNFDVNYYSGKFDAYQRTYILEPRHKDELYVPFLYRFMQSHARRLTEQSIGGVIKYLKIGFLTSAPISLPSFADQKRIVEIIDAMMKLCDEIDLKVKVRDSIRTSVRKSAIDAISSAQTPKELQIAWERIANHWELIAGTPEDIYSLKTLILDLAVRGDLITMSHSKVAQTIGWTTSELKLDESKLWSLPTLHKEKKADWNRIPLAKLGSWGSGGTPTSSRRDYYQNGTIPWAVIGDMNNEVMTSTEARITEKALLESSSKLVPVGAILIAMYGASIGKTAITGIECCTNQAIAHCIVDTKIVSKDYFFIVAKSLKRHLMQEGKGASQPNISQSVLKHLVIDLPPLDEQEKIVERVEALLQVCNSLELSLRDSEDLAEKFSRSVVSASA